VKALSSSPSTAKKEEKERERENGLREAKLLGHTASKWQVRN
jgi:hypothetical protein